MAKSDHKADDNEHNANMEPAGTGCLTTLITQALNTQKQVPRWKSCRFWLAVLLSVGFALGSCFRVSINIAIVCMISNSKSQKNNTGVPVHNETIANWTTTATSSLSYNVLKSNDTIVYINNGTKTHWTEDAGILYNVTNENLEEDRMYPYPSVCDSASLFSAWYDDADSETGEFTWSKEVQGVVLGAMFWGYLCVQIPCGWLAERFGPRKTITSGVFLVSVCALLSPLAARVSPYFLVVMRVLTGVFVSVLYPSAPIFWVHWAPQADISTLQGITFAGSEMGNALVFPLAGVLCKYGFDGGWASVFYIIGSVGAVWSVVWWCLSRDSPTHLPWISENERCYIQQDTCKRIGKEKVKTPWCSMMKTRGTWTLIVTHTLFNYTYCMLLIELPTYFKEVMHLDIQANGVVSMLPFLGTSLLLVLTGWLTDLIIRKDILSRSWTRKVMNTLGMVLPGILMVIVAQLDCRHQVSAVVLLCVSGTLTAMTWSGGFLASFVEVALVHSSTLFAISNTVASLPGVVTPYLVARLTPNGTQAEWQTTFYIAAAALVLSGFVYLLLGSSKPEPWALTLTSIPTDHVVDQNDYILASVSEGDKLHEGVEDTKDQH